jgi:hypothetical protein
MPQRQFPFDQQFDFSFRPSTYWPDLPSEQSVVSQIKGTVRRSVARRVLEGEAIPPEHVDTVLSESLSAEMRDAIGRLHPQNMGGEFLPDTESGEVEIARLDLQSTTGDAISVRANRRDASVCYRVVDEYENIFEVHPDTSREPLNFGEIVDLIDTTRDPMIGDDSDEYEGLVESYRDVNLGPEVLWSPKDVEGLRHFVRVSSDFYPQLEEYYELRADAWVRTRSGQPVDRDPPDPNQGLLFDP